MNRLIMLLGAGELGKELVISAQRLGLSVLAVDSYPGAPAMQVADHWEVANMLDGDALERILQKYQPHIIVPEIEAIRTEKLLEFENRGFQVVPTARVALARALTTTAARKSARQLARQVKINYQTGRLEK